jgi:hypothetical protein
MRRSTRSRWAGRVSAYLQVDELSRTCADLRNTIGELELDIRVLRASNAEMSQMMELQAAAMAMEAKDVDTVQDILVDLARGPEPTVAGRCGQENTAGAVEAAGAKPAQETFFGRKPFGRHGGTWLTVREHQRVDRPPHRRGAPADAQGPERELHPHLGAPCCTPILLLRHFEPVSSVLAASSPLTASLLTRRHSACPTCSPRMHSSCRRRPTTSTSLYAAAS